MVFSKGWFCIRLHCSISVCLRLLTAGWYVVTKGNILSLAFFKIISFFLALHSSVWSGNTKGGHGWVPSIGYLRTHTTFTWYILVCTGNSNFLEYSWAKKWKKNYIYFCYLFSLYFSFFFFWQLLHVPLFLTWSPLPSIPYPSLDCMRTLSFIAAHIHTRHTPYESFPYAVLVAECGQGC